MDSQDTPEQLLLNPKTGGEAVSDPGEILRPLPAADSPSRAYPATLCLILINIAFGLLSSAIPHGDWPFGANIGVLTLSGEWWRLFTSMFLHVQLWHLVGNLIFLWLFGVRLERSVGWKVLLFLYLACGLSGGLGSLLVHPETGGYGASGAIMGLAGALISLDLSRFRGLSRRGWLGFLLVVLVVFETIREGRSDAGIDNAGHIGGLLPGLLFGAFIALSWFQMPSRRLWILAGVTIGLAVGFVLISLGARYLLPLGRAYRAMQSGENDEAVRQLKLALAMRPEDESTKRLARELVSKDWTTSGLPKDTCSLFNFDPTSTNHDSYQTLQSSPCAGKICDGRVHVTKLPTGARLSYRGTVETSAPTKVDGTLQSDVTTTVIAQTLDVFGEVGCTVKDAEAAKQQFDAHGLVAHTLRVSRSAGTMSEVDPIAIALREDTLRVKP